MLSESAFLVDAGTISARARAQVFLVLLGYQEERGGLAEEEPYRSVSFYLAARTVSTSRRVPCIPNLRVDGVRLVTAVGFRFEPKEKEAGGWEEIVNRRNLFVK